MSQGSQIRIYDRAASIVFLKTKERFGGLSNMAGGFPLRVNGVGIRTSEALYQACRFPHMPDVQRTIINEHSPMTAKMRSKPFRKASRPDWDAVRVKIMRWSLRVKLAQNWREFGNLLLSTEDQPIVEQSRKDDFWGAKVVEDGTLVGMNVLGRLLMELREQLKGGETEILQFVEPLLISEFLLFGQPIETVHAESNANILRSIPRPLSRHAATPLSSNSQPSLFEQPMESSAWHQSRQRTEHRPLDESCYHSEFDQKETLQTTLIEMFSNITSTDAEKIAFLIADELLTKVSVNKSYQDAMKHMNKQNARIEHDKALDKVIAELQSDQDALLKQYNNISSFRKWLFGTIFAATYAGKPPETGR